MVETLAWLITRIVGHARTQLSCIRKPPRKSKKYLDPDFIDPDTVLHNHIISSSSHDTAVCYTDGSASPNPGPSGAGASIFLADPDLVIDLGCSLGHGSNNAAELYALGMLLIKLSALKLSTRPGLKRAHIFSDSKLALLAAVSRKRPLTNGPITRAVRLAFIAVSRILSIDLHWIRGHSKVGGNERVDRISKAYASAYSAHFPLDLALGAHTTTSNWPFGFPLAGLPDDFYLLHLPTPVLSLSDLTVTVRPSREPCLSVSSDNLVPGVGPGFSSPSYKKRARSPVAAVRRSSRIAASHRISGSNGFLNDSQSMNPNSNVLDGVRDRTT